MKNIFLATDAQISTERTLIICKKSVKIRESVAISCQLLKTRLPCDEGPILLFDGVCNLCAGSVQFVLKRNKKENILFASLQSEFGQKKLQESKLPEDYTASLVLLENGKTYVKSDAALRLAKHLDGLWKLSSIFLIIPKFIRNPVYDWIAINRYNWFGKKEVCWIPEPKWKARFLVGV